jgi:hypothetical protein
MSSYEIMENREQALMRLINESRYELQLSPLAPRELEATMKAWSRRLRPIPDDRLQRCFDSTLERHVTRSALIPAQILESWVIVRDELEQVNRNQERDECAYGCSVGGWVTVNDDGTRWDGESDKTAVRACPVHRPEGWRVGEFTHNNYRVQREP